MAKLEFKFGATNEITKQDAVKSAQQKDAKNANFHISADTDEILTLTGKFYEKAWERGDSNGTILMAGAKRTNGTEIQIPFGFFRTKELREDEETKTFNACYAKDASFEEIINGLKKDVKIQVKRGGFVYPGRSKVVDIDTVIFVK